MRKHSQRHILVETDYGQHRCLIEPDERKGYIVTAPHLPGVITWGRSIAHAKKMAREAIELCIECLVAKRAPPRVKITLPVRARVPVA